MIHKKFNFLKESNKLLELLATCYGPNGSNFIISKESGRIISKSGPVLVRELLFGETKKQNVFYKIAQSICGINNVRLNTKTTLILFCAFYNAFLKLKVQLENIDSIIRELDIFINNDLELYTQDIKSKINNKNIEPILENLCYRESDFYNIILEAIYKSGKNVLLSVEDGTKISFELEYKEGFQINRGWSSYYFNKDSSGERIIKNPLIAVFKQPLVKLYQIKNVLEEASQWKDNHLVIFAPHIESEALETLLLNDKNNHINSCSINTGMEDTLLEDMAALSNATIFDNQIEEYDSFNPEKFGSFKEIKITQHKTIITQYNNEECDNRLSSYVKKLNEELKNTEYDYDKEKLKKRISLLNNGFMCIKSGGYTETEIKERRSKLEKIILELKSMLNTGFVPGGGISYLYVGEIFSTLDNVSDEAKNVLYSIMCTPLYYLSGEDSFLVEKYLNVRNNIDMGYNLQTGELEDLKKSGIVDSYESFLLSIKMAFSAAKNLINSEILYVK